MGFRYAVIGAGGHGAAVAHDLGRHGEADEVRLLDVDLARAEEATARINGLLGRSVIKAGYVDASDRTCASQVLEGMHACVGAVPYPLNAKLAHAAVAGRVHYVDLGGDPAITSRQHELDERARAAGVVIVPDCGFAPGLTTVLAVAGMRAVDSPVRVRIMAGAVPESQEQPLTRAQPCATEGMIAQITGPATALAGGRVVHVETLSGLETIDFSDPIGRLEGFVTRGGASTCPQTFRGEVDGFEFRTLRRPGHCAGLSALRTLGFLDTAPVDVGGHPIVPREATRAIMRHASWRRDGADMAVARVQVEGRTSRWSADVAERHVVSGFAAPERLAGASAAIVAALLVEKRWRPGSHRLERLIDPAGYLGAIEARGHHIAIDRA